MSKFSLRQVYYIWWQQLWIEWHWQCDTTARLTYGQLKSYSWFQRRSLHILNDPTCSLQLNKMDLNKKMDKEKVPVLLRVIWAKMMVSLFFQCWRHIISSSLSANFQAEIELSSAQSKQQWIYFHQQSLLLDYMAKLRQLATPANLTSTLINPSEIVWCVILFKSICPLKDPSHSAQIHQNSERW